MRPRFILDEHLRGDLWKAIRRYNANAPEPIDVTRVDDPSDLPLKSSDPDILEWADRESRIVVSRDKRTMIADLRTRLAQGKGSPGLFIVKVDSSLSQVLAFLVEAAHSDDCEQWRNQWIFVP